MSVKNEKFGVEFNNLKKIEDVFDGIIGANPQDIFNDALRWAGKYLSAEMKKQTPVSKYGVRSKKYQRRTHPSGTLRKSIGYQVGGADIPVVWVSLRRKNNAGMDAWYSHLVVGGHEHGSITVKPNPIVRRTMDEALPHLQGKMQKMMENKMKSLLK